MEIEEIKKTLSDRNLAEVARRIGCTRAYLSAICKGRVDKLSDGMKDKLGAYLGGNQDGF